MTQVSPTAQTHGPSRLQVTTLIVLLAILILGLGAWTFGPRPAARWEYRIEAPSDVQFEARMDSLGRQGWELVSARRATASSEYDRSASYEMIFKRPR